jgi:hypothetical protein
MEDQSDKITKNIEIIASETEDDYSNDDIYEFNSWGADLSFRELIERYVNDELIKPELQRYYVWDRTEASRFVESILLGLPIPSIFLAKQSDETLLIIDGYQRIKTVFDYVRGIFTKDGKVFKLNNSEKINERWRGKAFSELSDIEQRKIKNTTIHSIIFVQTHPMENNTGMYQVFERINTSGRTLFPQEIRNCIYQGNLNKLLFKLNKNSVWRKMFGTKEVDPRMRDAEFILRYLAMRKINFNTINKRAISLKKVLNLFMAEKEHNLEQKLIEYESDFISTLEKAYKMFRENAFRNISKKTNQIIDKFNPPIFDSIMLAIADSPVPENIRDWENRRKALLENENYQNAIKIRTTDVENINLRINLAKEYLFRKDE